MQPKGMIIPKNIASFTTDKMYPAFSISRC